MNKIRKTPAGLECPLALSEEFITLDDDNVCKSQLGQTKTFKSLFKAKKISLMQILTDENEMKNAAPVSTPSEMRNITKNIFNYLDAHSKGEMNNKMNDPNSLWTICR
ncbi:hypothetical protein TNCV_1284431 [Trichonephila clavipes]|uniref:Uncharacterized protein n=1 Tax=Trichonephila clavipes TaxID=2585209 RepID=A0A8X6SZT5_TRICX|nr:hypothetical protein TNCV_1284431 [Trichonephila clavipes]